MPTKVQVLLNGDPLEGATVYVGAIGGQEKETDEDGSVALPDVEVGFAGFVDVAILAEGIWATANAIIKYNETTVIDLGEREE